MIYSRKFVVTVTLLVLLGSLLMGGCTNMTPVNPPDQATPAPAPAPAPAPSTGAKEHKVTYNYGDTGPVQLSVNNLKLKVGEKLILIPAPGLTKNTRFTSADESFWGDIMQQEGDQSNGQLVFSAKKAGKGKLKIIPNSTESARATDLWVTVE